MTVLLHPGVAGASTTQQSEIAVQVSKRLRVKPWEAGWRRPTVSVVIPCYNYARYLTAAVESALSQPGVDVDVIVVDDASNDESLNVARQLTSKDSRVRVIAHEKNLGPVKTFNDGLTLAKGEFLVRLDADDLLTPGSLRRATDVMLAFPSVGLVYGHPLHFTGDRLPPSRNNAKLWTIWPGGEWLSDRCRSGYNVITSPEVLMRRSLLARVGGQRDLAHSHDMEMWLRLSAYSDVAYIHGADQAWHREHHKSLSSGVDSIMDFHERRAAFNVLFASVEEDMPATTKLRAQASLALAKYCIEAACRLYDHREVDIQKVKLLSNLAEELVPNLETVPGWAGLKWRKSVGPGRAACHPIFLTHRLSRGLLARWKRMRWHRLGY